MTCWVVTPVKAPDACKTRLAPALGEAERRTLVASMLRRVFEAASGARGVDEVLLLGPARHGLFAAVRLLADPGRGLNAALASARDVALAEGVERLVILSGDLPHLRAADVEALVALAPHELGVAPDRGGMGTNALSLPLPSAAGFEFRYGEASCARHLEEAARLGLAARVVRSDGLGFDIDAPEDLAALALP